MNNTPVLFIPRISTDVTKAQVQRVFENLNLGKIKRIDLVKNLYQDNCQKVFIHYDTFLKNKKTEFIISRFNENKDVKIIYDTTYLFFWKVNKYNPNYKG